MMSEVHQESVARARRLRAEAFRALLTVAIAPLHARTRRQRAREQLHATSDRELKDIGLQRSWIDRLLRA